MAQKVEYIVELNRTGAGATQAANELKQVEVAAAKVNAQTAAASGVLTTFSQTTRTTTSALRALGSTAVLLGGSEFPKLTVGLAATSQALQAVRASNIALQSSFAITSAGIAGVVAALASAVFWWRAYAAQQQEAASAKALKDQTTEFTESLRMEVEALSKAGAITDATFTKLMRTLNSAGGLQQVRDFLKELETGTAAGHLADMARTQANAEAQIRNNNPNLSAQSQAVIIKENYKELVETTQALELMGLMTSKEATDARTEADTRRLNALTALGAKLTELEQLERAAAQEFAAGLSAAIVQFASGAKSAEDAFKSFAATFLQQISQMILQMIILNTLKAVGFGFAGGGQAGALRAANGAILFAANGVSGVSEVSTPTYFPKFNVIAGEAGREVMTVMARPRLMDVGGIAAQVGDVGPNRLALTNASDLQRLGNGVGGRSEVYVTLDPGLRGQIVEQAAGTSLHLVTRKMTERGPLSENTKRLLNQ